MPAAIAQAPSLSDLLAGHSPLSTNCTAIDVEHDCCGRCCRRACTGVIDPRWCTDRRSRSYFHRRNGCVSSCRLRLQNCTEQCILAIESRQSRKREREVSLEPGTPQAASTVRVSSACSHMPALARHAKSCHPFHVSLGGGYDAQRTQRPPDAREEESGERTTRCNKGRRGER